MSAEIDVESLRAAVNAILDHLIEDLRIKKVEIDQKDDLYWHCPASEVHNMSKTPVGLDIGRLSDDIGFVKLIQRGQSGDVSYSLVHVAHCSDISQRRSNDDVMRSRAGCGRPSAGRLPLCASTLLRLTCSVCLQMTCVSLPARRS